MPACQWQPPTRFGCCSKAAATPVFRPQVALEASRRLRAVSPPAPLARRRQQLLVTCCLLHYGCSCPFQPFPACAASHLSSLLTWDVWGTWDALPWRTWTGHPAWAAHVGGPAPMLYMRQNLPSHVMHQVYSSTLASPSSLQGFCGERLLSTLQDGCNIQCVGRHCCQQAVRNPYGCLPMGGAGAGGSDRRRMH
jgi:hypothetical protein